MLSGASNEVQHFCGSAVSHRGKARDHLHTEEGVLALALLATAVLPRPFTEGRREMQCAVSCTS